MPWTSALIFCCPRDFLQGAAGRLLLLLHHLFMQCPAPAPTLAPVSVSMLVSCLFACVASHSCDPYHVPWLAPCPTPVFMFMCTAAIFFLGALRVWSPPPLPARIIRTCRTCTRRSATARYASSTCRSHSRLNRILSPDTKRQRTQRAAGCRPATTFFCRPSHMPLPITTCKVILHAVCTLYGNIPILSCVKQHSHAPRSCTRAQSQTGALGP